MITAVNNWLGQILVLALDQSMLPIEEQMTDEQLNTAMYDMLYACMTAEEIGPVTNTVTLAMNRTEEGWKLDSVSMNALTDAMMGGFFSAMAQLG